MKRPAPCLGEHNEYVCTQLLGIPDEEFIKLYQEEYLNKGVFLLFKAGFSNIVPTGLFFSN